MSYTPRPESLSGRTRGASCRIPKRFPASPKVRHTTGWLRIITGQNLAAPARKESGRTVVYDQGEGAIVPGRYVDHPQFGEGEVLSVEGHGERARAVIAFREVGRKKVMLKFAGLRLVEH